MEPAGRRALSRTQPIWLVCGKIPEVHKPFGGECGMYDMARRWVGFI